MAFLFSRSKQKAPLELVRSAKESLQRLDKLPPNVHAECQRLLFLLANENQKGDETLAQKLAQMKLILQGTQGQHAPPPKLATADEIADLLDTLEIKETHDNTETETIPEQQFQLINALISEDILLLLATNIYKLPFEARKDTQFIFSSAFRYKHPTASAQEPIALHHILQSRPQIVVALCNGYDHRESAMPCGSVLREALKYDAVAALILYDEKNDLEQPLNLSDVHTDKPSSGEGVFWKFFDWITKSSFDVGTDAFNTFREILSKHKEMVATYLETNYDQFFLKYNQKLIQSENYVIKRQSIKLLGELLLDRANYNVMTKYVDSGDHLKICMTLLRDDRKMINYEAFHVFKVGCNRVPKIGFANLAHRSLSRIQTSRWQCSVC